MSFGGMFLAVVLAVLILAVLVLLILLILIVLILVLGAHKTYLQICICGLTAALVSPNS